MPFRSTKTYGHERGLSCAFRQWRSDSHCAQLHGYALGFRFVFEATELDANKWVVDFGSFGPLKEQLERWFDHTVAIAKDDPFLPDARVMHEARILNLVEMDFVGCESFARHAYNLARDFLRLQEINWRVRCVSVECFEHGSNSAIYLPSNAEV